MNDPVNVHPLPTVRRKVGRRRDHPVPGLPVAELLTFVPAQQPTTLEEQIADCRTCINTMADGLILALRAINAHYRKYPESRP
jgi:hypothetical protein